MNYIQVLTDFDYTLTYPHFNGKPVATSHGKIFLVKFCLLIFAACSY